MIKASSAPNPKHLFVSSSSVFSVPLWLVFCLTGCGQVGNLSGNVTVNGQPAVGVRIMMWDSQGLPQVTPVGDDSRYEFKELPAGPVKIAVVAGRAAAGAKGGKATPILPKYGDPTTSGLTTEVKAGANTYDIELAGPSR